MIDSFMGDACALSVVTLIMSCTPSKNTEWVADMNDEEIKAECIRRDERDNHLVYMISTDARTFKLVYSSISWQSLNHGERYSMVKNRNIFDSAQECSAAIARALDR